MGSDKKIFTAFLLNAVFSLIELVGGLWTGSIAVISDSVHDLGDSISIGLSWLLERRSKRKADATHTWGYRRYSVLGSLVTTVILTVGSVFVIVNAINRLLHPAPINYNGMILLALFGAAVNFAAAWFTREGDSMNQKAVNLHMLEDVLGWIVVLLGAIVMRFVRIDWLDPVLSMVVAVYILWNALQNLKQIGDVFLEKTPEGVHVEELTAHLSALEGVQEVTALRVRSLDGFSVTAEVEIVAEHYDSHLLNEIKEELAEHGISHSAVQIALPGALKEHHNHEEHACCDHGHHHHHHHHHHHGHHHH
jgi:cobalt-zinc-cadmium efflux system protein